MPNRKNDPLYQAALAASYGKATGSAVNGTNSGGYTSTASSSVSKKGKAYPTSYALAQAAKRSAERMKNTDYTLYGSARISPSTIKSRRSNAAANGQDRDEFDSRVRSNYAKNHPERTGGLYAAAQRSATSLNILSDHLKAAEATVTIAQNNYQRNANVNTAAQYQKAQNDYNVALKATQNQYNTYRTTMAALKEYERNGAGRDAYDARVRSNYGQKQRQKIMNSGTEYGKELKLSDDLQKASARYQDSQSKLASAQRNAPMDTNRGERRVTNTPEIQAARTQLGTDRKSLQEAQKKANDYVKKQVEAASKKYNGKFDEKAARQLASVSNPTLSQQAEMRALVEAYDKTEAKKRGDVHSMDPIRQALEAKSGTLSARVSQTVEGGLRDSAAGYLNAGRAALDWANEAHGGEMNDTAKTVRNWLATNADKMDRQSQQNIQNAKANLGSIGQGAVDIGAQMTQMYADSLAGMGKGALGSMAVRVFGGSYQDAREQGASANRAIAYAGLQSLKEYATEKMFGLAVPIYGRGSMMGVEEMIADGIERAASQATSKFGQQAVHSFLTMLGSFGTEGLEEFVSALGDPIVSALTIGGKDDLKQYGNSDYWQDVGYQFLVGGIMGMLGSGVTQVTGQSTVDPVRMQELQESRENLTNIRNTNARLFNDGSLTAEGQQVISNNFAANQRQQNPSVGFTNYGSSNVDYQARMGRAIPTNLQQAAINATNAQPAQPVGSQATAMHIDTESVTNPVAPYEAPAVTAAAAPTVTNTVPVSQQVAPTVRAETPANINENIDTINTDVDEQVHNPTVTTPAPAPTYTPSAIRQATYQSEMPTTDREATERKMTYAPMIAAINKGKGLGVNGKRAFTQSANYDVSPDTYYRGFIDYYNAGQSGTKFKSVKSEFGSKLYPEQRYAAWVAGQNDAAAKTSANKSVMKSVPVSANPGLARNEYSEKLDNDTYSLIDKMGKDLGHRIVMMSTLNGGTENGVNKHTGEIFIAADAEDSYETIQNKVISAVTRHEVSHSLETLAPEEYQELSDHIFRNFPKLSAEVYGESIDANTLIMRKVSNYKAHGVDLSNNDAMREIVADFVGHMDEDSIRSIVNSNRSLAGKIIDILRDVVANIKKAFGGDGGSMAETLRLFEKTYRAASEQAKKNSGNTGENAQSETSESSQFSIIKVKADTDNTVRTKMVKDSSPSVSANDTVSSSDSAVNQEQYSLRSSGQEVTDNNGDPVATMDETGHAQFSIKTYDASGRAILNEWLDKAEERGDLDAEDVKDIKESMEAIYKISKELADSGKYMPFTNWSNAEVEVDANGNPIFSVVKANGEYPLNMDFSLVCKKRRTLDAVFDSMIKEGIFNDFNMGQEEIVKVNEVIRNHGFETACAICFVEAKRFRSAKIADDFAKIYNKLVKSMVSGTGEVSYFNYGENKKLTEANDNIKNDIAYLPDSQLNMDTINRLADSSENKVENKIARYLRDNPEGRHLVDRGDFMTASGFSNVRSKNPEVLSLYNAKKGSGGAKATFGDVQYLSEVLSNKKFNAEAAYAVGGVRVQSFSDYVPRLFFDYAEMVSNLAAKKLPAHAYTKEELFARQFGLTGIKINLSLVPKYVKGGKAPGLDADGNYAWAGESFDYDVAIEIQNADGYSENCGTIAVGVSDMHIEQLLKDKNIKMVIPYHKSSLNPIVAMMNQIAEYTDYTKYQNTRYRSSGVKLSAADMKKEINFNERLHKTKMTPQEAAEEYVRWCEKNNYLPKFDQFAYQKDSSGNYVTNENGQLVVNENYYKLLEDFTLFNNKGDYAPQKAVQMRFPTKDDAFGSLASLVERGLDEDAQLEAKRDAAVPAITEELATTLKNFKGSADNAEKIKEHKKQIKNAKAKYTREYKAEAKKRAAILDSMLPRSEQFSLKDPVETTPKLVAIHNLSAENTIAAFEMGGFPSPSIAITPDTKVHNQFGEISVVFRRETIDPSVDRRNKLYGGDAYTPTFPTITRSVKNKQLIDLKERWQKNLSNYADGIFVEDALGAIDSSIEMLNSGASYESVFHDLVWHPGIFDAYLATHNIPVEIARDENGNVDKLKTMSNIGQIRSGDGFAVLADVEKWLRSELSDVVGERRLAKTSGMKESDTEVTLENIIKAMYSRGDRAVGIYVGVDQLQSAVIEDFQSVDEARDKAGRISHDENYNQIAKEKFWLMEDLIRYTRDYNIPLKNSSAYRNEDDAKNRIRFDVNDAVVDAVKGKRTIDSITKAFAAHDLVINNDIAKQWQNVFNEIKETPVEYFEAKPKRVVGLDEIEGIAIPEAPDYDAEDYEAKLGQIRTYAEQNGIPISMYELDEDEDLTALNRMTAVNEFAASFSFKEDLRNMRNDNDAYKEYLEAQVEKVTKQNEKLRSEMKRNTTNARDPKEMSRFVRKLLKDVSSPLDSTEVADRLNQLFMDIDRGYVEVEDFDDYMLPGLDDYDYADQETGEVKMKRIDLRNSLNMYKEFEKVATWLIESAEAKDHDVIEQAKEIRDYLRRSPIIYDESIMNDVSPDFSSWRKRQKFRMHKAKYGERMNVDQVYMEMMEEFPGWFDETIINPADQLLRISEVMDILDRASVNNPWSEAYDVAIDGLTQDLISGYVEVPVKITYADRQAALRKAQHSRDVARANARVEKERAKNRERMENERQKNRERINNIIQRNAQSKAKALEEQRIKFLNREEKAAERREMREIRNKIYKHAQKLSTKLLKPTDTQHVPEELKAAVAEALRNINIESRTTWDPYTHSVRWDGRGEPTARTKAWQAASLEYQKIIDAMEKGQETMTTMLIDPDIDYYFQQVIQFSEIPVHSMTKQQLETTWSLITAIEHSIASANKALAFEKYARISDLAEDIHEKASLRRNKRGSIAIDLENPYTYFSHFGEAGMRIYRTLRNAQDTVEKNTKLVHDMVGQLVTKEDIKRLATERVEFDVEDGYHIVFTKEQLMDIYLYSKRRQAVEHLLSGGVIQPEIKAHPTKKLPKIDRGTAVTTLTEKDINMFVDALTDEEKRIADGLQEIASGFLAGLGNTVSLQAYGYKKFGDPNYWAIATAKEQTHQTAENDRSNARSIKNIGMAKSLVPHANNALDIRGVFNTFAQSTADMIEYNAWLLPMEDCNRLFNYKFDRNDTFKTVIEKTAGKGAQKYWMELMKDIQNGIKPTGDTQSGSHVSAIIGRAKGAAVGANIRVVIQQPTALFRATAVLSPLSITKGMAKGATPGKAYEKASEYAPIAAIKARGSFDQGSSRTIYQDLFGINTPLETISDASGYLAGKADEVTWGRLWNACEWECRSKHPDLALGSEEFYQETGRIFSDMIDQSQVVDGILQRSQIMRSQEIYHQVATAFMGEPIMTLNMIMRAYDKWKYETRPYERSKALKGIGVTTTALLLNAVANSVAQSLIDAMRDFDDDDYWKKFLKAMVDREGIKSAIESKNPLDSMKAILGSNLLDNLNMLGNIPYIKDLMSFATGFTVQRMDAQVFGDLYTAVAAIYDSDNYKSDKQKWIDVVNQCAKVFGIPTKNLYRDAYAALRTYAYETDNLGLMYALDKWYYNEGSSKYWVQDKFAKYIVVAQQQGNNDLALTVARDMENAGLSRDAIEKAEKYVIKQEALSNPETAADINNLINEIHSTSAYKSLDSSYQEYVDKTAQNYFVEVQQAQYTGAELSGTSAKVQDAVDQGISAADYLVYNEVTYAAYKEKGGTLSYEETARALRKAGLSGAKLDKVFAIMKPKATKAGSEY